MNVNLEDVLSALRRARGKGLSLKQLAGQLHVGHSQNQALRKGLSHLLKDGRAVFDGHVYREVPPKPQNREQPREEHTPLPRRAPAAMVEGARARREQLKGGDGAEAPRKAGSQVTGVIHVKSEGYGFVSPLIGEGGRDNDLFVPPQYIKGALDGDVVLARAMKGRDGRLAGEVLEVIERRRQLALGIYQAKDKACWVIPHDRHLAENISVPRHPRARDGEMVKVRLHREKPGALSGEIISVLGNRGDPRFEILASAYAEGFSDEFDPATALAAQSVPDRVHPEEISARRDLRHLPLVTIDGEDARDFDDAVHVSRTASGYRLVVAIADVAHYVRPGGPLDREALRRATSVYFPGTVLPMLPERLSNGICSLNPDVDRLCMVCDLALDKNGKPLHAELYEGVMRSARPAHLHATSPRRSPGKPIRTCGRCSRISRSRDELSKKLTHAAQAARLDRLRSAGGEDPPRRRGPVAEIDRRPRNDAHRLVEEFMLAANEGVARFFDVRGLPTVYRVHGAARRGQARRVHRRWRARTASSCPRATALTPRRLNELLRRSQASRQQQRAQLAAAALDDAGAVQPRQHRPLRPRRAALPALHLADPALSGPHGAPAAQGALGAGRAAAARARARRAGGVPRRHLGAVLRARARGDEGRARGRRVLSALYMQDKVGEKFKAVVSGVADFGLFCEMQDVFVEGLVPSESLGEGVRFEKELQRLVVGTSGRAYSIGDGILVELVSADPARRRITLALAQKGVMQTERWLTPADLEARPASKPRRQAPQAAGQAPRRPPRGSPPARPPRRKGRRGGRR